MIFLLKMSILRVGEKNVSIARNERLPFLSICIIFSCVMFLVLLFISMIIYNGGNFSEVYFHHYSFHKNFLSDLGREFTFTGLSNSKSQLLFQLALIFISISAFALFLHIMLSFCKLENKNKIGIIGSIIGFGSSFMCIAVAFTPCDLMFEIHGLCVFIWLLFILAAKILIMIAFFRIKGIQRKNRILITVTNVILLAYISLNVAFGLVAPYWQTITKIVTQKIIIVILYYNLATQAIGLNKKVGLQHKSNNSVIRANFTL
jgi:hypothetical protein